jgi:hypothetical protein
MHDHLSRRNFPGAAVSSADGPRAVTGTVKGTCLIEKPK